jgi:hypothetical protein
MPIPVITNPIEAPQIHGPLDQYAKGVQLKSLLGQQQLQQLQIKDTQDQMAQRQALRQGYKEAIIQGPDGQSSIDFNKLQQSLADSGHGDAVPAIQKSAMEFQESKGKLQKQGQELQVGMQDMYGHAAAAIQAAGYDPKVAHTLLDTMPQSPQLNQLRQTIDTDPAKFKQMVDTAKAASPAQQKIQAEKDVAAIRSGATPLGDTGVQQANAGIAQRWQVLHPGMPPPASFQLQPGATGNDFKRVDDLMKGTEQSEQSLAQQKTTNAATAAQRATTNEMAQERLAQSKQAHEDTKSTQGSKPVLAFDAENKAHLLAKSDAQAGGLTGITEATPKQIDDAKTHTVVLNDMQTKLNDVVSARKALDQDIGQRAIISTALSHSEPGVWNDLRKGSALKGATQQTKDYIQSVLSLKESALGLPKEITGGSRTSEIQGNALFQTLPSGSSVNSQYALEQAQKFQANIDRLHDRVPQVRGMQNTPQHPDLGGSKGAATSAAVPANVTKALANIGPGVHKLSDGSTWMKGTDGSITKQ